MFESDIEVSVSTSFDIPTIRPAAFLYVLPVRSVTVNLVGTVRVSTLRISQLPEDVVVSRQ